MKKRIPVISMLLLAAAAFAAIPEDNGSGQATLVPKQAEILVRVLEGIRETSAEPVKFVTSSYLRYLLSANIPTENDLDQERASIRKVFNLKDVTLLTEASLLWERGKGDLLANVFRLDGREYLIRLAFEGMAPPSRFKLEVQEQAGGKKTSLLDTAFTVPQDNISVFGFEDSQGKPYFLSLRVQKLTVDDAAPAPAAPRGPRLLKVVEPVYPEEAKKAKVGGFVIIEATTDETGRVAKTNILRSIPLLDQAAVDAVKQWVYEPLIESGRPREITFTVTVRFDPDEGKAQPSVGGVTGGVKGGVSGGVTGGVVGGVQGAVGEDLITVSKQKSEEFGKGAIRAVGKIKPPRLVKAVDPVYPEEAKKKGISGVVILEARASETGDIEDVIILRSIPGLDDAAVAAVKQWKYEPMVVDGTPRKVVFTMTCRFTLDKEDLAAMHRKKAEEFARGAVKAIGEIEPPKLIKSVHPVYPEDARQKKIEGVVILSVKTDESGQIIDTMVLRSIPALDAAALAAVKQWVYEPKIIDGKPQKIVFTVTVRFQLK
ncbi:MAG: energy transducer TonB [Candidatus Aminicenantes bacterium]|nr:energy transducer TonB [Candidatus Aminicenantes bacterium]